MAERIGRKWVSPAPFSLSKNGFLVRFVICTSSYWLGQQSFTNLVMLCRTVIACKSHEVLKRDGVTLLCWWGNIHKFCISDEVTSYSQSMYLTIPVIIRAWILLKNACCVISVVYINIDEEMFLLLSTECRNCRKPRDAPDPADTWRKNNVIMTSKRRRFDVMMALLLRRVPGGGEFNIRVNSWEHLSLQR